MTMITFDHGTTRFNFRVVGVVIEDGRVLMAQVDDHGWWVFPGGRAELLESSVDAVEREMYEELGQPVRAEGLLWVVENFFHLDGYDFHHIEMYYRIRLAPGSALLAPDAVLSYEDGGSRWECRWLDLARLDDVEVRPPFLQQALRDIPDSPRHVVVRYERDWAGNAR